MQIVKKPIKHKSRIPRNAVVAFTPVPYDPKYDDYEIPDHIDFDYTKAKRNPYVGMIEYTHGGKRNGAGRKSSSEPLESHTVTLYPSHVKYLRGLDKNLSRAIRNLVQTHLGDASPKKPLGKRKAAA